MSSASPEDWNRSSFRNVVFSYYSEFRTMDSQETQYTKLCNQHSFWALLVSGADRLLHYLHPGTYWPRSNGVEEQRNIPRGPSHPEEQGCHLPVLHPTETYIFPARCVNPPFHHWSLQFALIALQNSPTERCLMATPSWYTCPDAIYSVHSPPCTGSDL
jgi:hypothetical protein